jgi:hypothetical protein
MSVQGRGYAGGVTGMVPTTVNAATAAVGFPGRWKAIAVKLGTRPARLSDLSSHPCFARNALCREMLQYVAATLADALELAAQPPGIAKLQMQSAVDTLASRLDINCVSDPACYPTPRLLL